MRRLLALLALVGAAFAAGAVPAGATNECRGLAVCVPVAGPWVVVPTGRSVPRPRVEYQLSCPRGYVVGGLDAELSDPAIDIGFAGTLGSPVNPGITTSRVAVFFATYAGASVFTPSFRPHIGCVPAAGSGGRVPVSAAALPQSRPTVRRVRTVRIRPGRSRRVVQSCAASEHLIAGSHAVGFYTATPPSEGLVAGLSAAQAVRDDRVSVTVRAGKVLLGVPSVVQVTAVCAGGR